MRYLRLLLLFLLIVIFSEARTVYFDGEDGTTDVWLSQDNGVIQNIYNQELDSRVVRLSPGTYDIGLGERGWNNRTERVLSWNMNITDAYTIYVSVNTIHGHRWLFYNYLNVDVGHHGVGILNGIGSNTNNGTWQKVTVDLDRDLQDTEPDNRIISVEGMRFGGVLGMIDNITLDTPHRTVYENGEDGISHWRVTDNTPAGATINFVAQDSDNDETRDNVIQLIGHNQDNSFTIGGDSAENGGWNNQTEHVLQLKMRNSELFTIIVHVQTAEGNKRLIYTPRRVDNGISEDGLEIHHGLVITRDGDGAHYGAGTDNRWQTYTIDLEDDLKDYDADNRLIAVNGITIRGSTLIDDIELLSSVEPNSGIENNTPTVYEDGEDGTTNGWRVRQGDADDIVNVFDTTRNSRVIQFTGGGSYILGALNGENAWHNTTQKMISWRMRTSNAYAIYVIVHTTNGLRYLFYTSSQNRGLRHGFDTGIHHGLGSTTINGQWRRVTRDLERDLKDAEPENDIISVDGFIYSGGNDGMIDDIVLYNAEETIYEDGEHGVGQWIVSDNTPEGATITTIADNDRQGRHLQGNVISLSGAGFDNAYMIGGGANSWNNRDKKILQWRFRNFGSEVEVINHRGIIRDPNAFEFRVSVDTTDGARDLIYTLGAENLGLIENGNTIHHGLGDDRIRGSVWSGDNPMNELGLWQTITRDLEEDIRDFEPNNRLVSVNSLQVRNSGLIDDIKMLSNANIPNNSDDNQNCIVYEDAEDGNTNGWRVFANGSGEATITNIMDNDRGSRVIQLQGVGKQDAYRLRSDDNHNWNDREHHNMRWSMNFGEDFTIYIAVQTTNGRRYLTYTPRDDNRGLRGEYILIGLGADSDNGTWQEFTRNLDNDIAEAEENNELVSIDSIIIRGSGRLDDIEAF